MKKINIHLNRNMYLNRNKLEKPEDMKFTFKQDQQRNHQEQLGKNPEDIRINPKYEVEQTINKISKNNLNYYEKHDYIIDIYHIEKLYGILLDYNKNNTNLKSNTIYNKYTINDVTIIVCLKNRPKRFKIFYSFIKMYSINSNIKIIFIEGKSDNLIDTSLFMNDNNVYHYIVDIGNVWSRSVLLNYGMSKCETELVILSDIDFIFPPSFWNTLEDTINKLDIDNYLLGLPVYETNNTLDNNNNVIRKKNDPYGACYITNKNLLINNGGFNTKFIGHGMEERELQVRLSKNNILTLYTVLVHPNTYVLHYSHNENIRHLEKNNLNEKKYYLDKLEKNL